MNRTLGILMVMGTLCGVACSETADEGQNNGAAGQAVEVSFRTMVGATQFGCATSYDGIGSTASTFTPSDLRMYVHDVRLIDGDGAEAAIDLDQDGTWQYQDVALLDFEDGCGGGDAGMNTTVRGTVTAGVWTGIAFGVGVPFALNHGDAASAPAPLDNSAMFWSWNQGFKHIRLDASTTGLPDDGYHIHMGSTGCEGDGQGNVTGCAADNRPQIRIEGFDATKNPVVFDLAALLADTDVDTNTERTAPGCFGDADDPDCDGILARFGLTGSPQSAFRAP